MKQRTPYVLQMPVAEHTRILRPRDVILKFDDSTSTVDIGVMCFTKRATTNSKRCNHTYDIDSYDQRREKAIRKLIKAVSDEMLVGAKKPITAVTELRRFSIFMKWVDDERLDCGLDCQITLRSIFEKYLVITKNQVATGTIRRNTIAAQHRTVLSFLRVCLADEHWGADFLLMKRSMRDVNHTEVPQEFEVGTTLGVCSAVFRELAEKLLSAAQFPWEIALPFGADDSPRSVLVMANGRSNIVENFSWNEVTGLPNSVDELMEKYKEKNDLEPKRRRMAWSIYYHNLRVIKRGNDLMGRTRFELGLLSAHCFSYFFLANLGANATQFLGLEYEPNLLSDIAHGKVTRQGYRRIKGRAGGKEVSFEVPLGFMADFKLYLRLREYLVGEQDVKTLLVGQVGNTQRVRKLQTHFKESLFSRLATFGFKPPRLTPSELRVTKQNFGITESTLQVAANLMGHSVAVARRDYSNGTLDQQQAEVGKFFEAVHRVAVLERVEGNPHHVESAVGKCSELDEPEAIAEDLPVQPDCDSPTGCLFCAKYVLHADATDLKKLLSCRVCLKIESSNGGVLRNRHEINELLLKRLDWLISEVRGRIGEVEFLRVERDVELGENLDVFWARKVELMVNLDFV